MSLMQMPICINLKDNFWDQLIKDKDLTDTTLQIKDSEGNVIWEFSVHSIVLRRRSRVFRNLIDKIDGTFVLDNKNASLEVVSKFIKYLYVGDLFVETWQEVISLLELAEFYQVTTLVDALEVNLVKFINLMNVCQILNEAIRLNIKKVESACLDLIVRSCVVIFATGDFQRLSEEALLLILSDDRLNVPHEVDLLLALLCWAKNSAFINKVKLDDEGVFKLISPRLLKSIRLGLISKDEQKLVAKELAEMIFTEPEDRQNKKPRSPAKEACLSIQFANVLLRRAGQAIAWLDLGNSYTQALRFSVTMPIFLGGFLAVYKSDRSANMYITIQDSKMESEVKHVFTAKQCEHELSNEAIGDSINQSTCFEPDYPILVSPGEEVTVHFRNLGEGHRTSPLTQFPVPAFQTNEGPAIHVTTENVHTVRKIFFMSACGRCAVSPLV